MRDPLSHWKLRIWMFVPGTLVKYYIEKKNMQIHIHFFQGYHSSKNISKTGANQFLKWIKLRLIASGANNSLAWSGPRSLGQGYISLSASNNSLILARQVRADLRCCGFSWISEDIAETWLLLSSLCSLLSRYSGMTLSASSSRA